MAGLSNTQAAYRYYNDRFMAGMNQRAQNLWTDGYRVTPLEDGELEGDETAAPPTRFMVYKESDAEKSSEADAAGLLADDFGYVVNPIHETCTCDFFHGQKAEPLNESGEPVSCKHIFGLSALIAEEIAYWNMKAQHTANFRREIEYIRISRQLTETMKRVGK